MKPEKIFSKYPQIEMAFQYGSSVGKNPTRARDIDVAILFKEGLSAEKCLDIQLAVAEAFSKFYKKEIDVAVLNTASPFLAYQVIKHGRLLYDPGSKAHNFTVQTLTRYFDALQFHRFFNERLEKKLGV